MAIELSSIISSVNVTSPITGTSVTDTLGNLLNGKEVKKRHRIFDISDYGALANVDNSTGYTANLDAFNAAKADLTASPRGGVILIPNDHFYFKSPLTVSPVYGCVIEGAGPAAKIIFKETTDANLLTINGADTAAVGLRNIRIQTTSATNLDNVVILRGGREKQSLICDNVFIEGDASAKPSDTFLTLVNPYNCTFRNVNIEAGSVGSYGTTGIGIKVYGDGDQTPGAISVDFAFYGAMISRVSTGFKIICSATVNHTVEGVQFNDCIVAGVQTGVDYSSAGDMTPATRWSGGHINFSKYGIVLTRIAQFTIHDCLFYADVYNGPITALQTNQQCKTINFHHNTVWTVDTQNTGLKPGMNGCIFTSGSEYCVATFNEFFMQTVDACIRIDPGVVGNRIGFNHKVTGGGIMNQDNGIGTVSLGGDTVR